MCSFELNIDKSAANLVAIDFVHSLCLFHWTVFCWSLSAFLLAFWPVTLWIIKIFERKHNENRCKPFAVVIFNWFMIKWMHLHSSQTCSERTNLIWCRHSNKNRIGLNNSALERVTIRFNSKWKDLQNADFVRFYKYTQTIEVEREHHFSRINVEFKSTSRLSILLVFVS